MSNQPRSLKWWARLLSVLLVTNMLTAVLSLIELPHILAMVQALPNASVDPLMLLKLVISGPLRISLAIASSLTGLATTIVSCIWLYRAACIARRRHPHVMRTSPGWLVGWFFIPIANLFMPLVAILRMWRTTPTPRTGSVVAVWLWWCAYTASNLLSGLSGFIAQNIAAKHAIIERFHLSAYSSLLSLFAAILFLLWIWRYTARSGYPEPLPDASQPDTALA